ncbi:MAG: hypothetical protein ACRCZ2_05195 [Fusobacteriaceae bacterium]
MSNVNIAGLIKNQLKHKTNIYDTLIEAIVNSIQSIEEKGSTDGKITIKLNRNQNQLDLDSSTPDIESIEIVDNGIGFNTKNRNSYDTIYSDSKQLIGGKGFGRLTYLKYFNEVIVDSVFFEDGRYFKRLFRSSFNGLIEKNETLVESDSNVCETKILLNNLINDDFDKGLQTIARKLVDKLLIYFINDQYKCPEITVIDTYKNEILILNNYLKGDNCEIIKVHNDSFSYKNEIFEIKIFKIFSPYNQTSKVCLTAHNREVVSSNLDRYIPEFAECFNEEEGQKNYIIRSYIMGNFLDNSVSVERDRFEFTTQDSNKIYLDQDLNQSEIEKEAAVITSQLFHDEIEARFNKKKTKLNDYVIKESPYYKPYLVDFDFQTLKLNPSNLEMEQILADHKYRFDITTKLTVRSILNQKSLEDSEKVNQIINDLSKTQESDLAKYIVYRKCVLELFEKSLEKDENGDYKKEEDVHKIIIPMRTDCTVLPYEKNNLWILDEKLNFCEFIASDQQINTKTKNLDRPDIVVFNRKIAFRSSENEAHNPITIFEFKRPQRKSAKTKDEDHIEQIIKYVEQIKEGKYQTQKGRDINVGETTPFYGYLICDLTPNVKKMLLKHDCKMMPDGKGWFKWHGGYNLYIEILSWDKVLEDAKMRNKVFFRKLGLE